MFVSIILLCILIANYGYIVASIEIDLPFVSILALAAISTLISSAYLACGVLICTLWKEVENNILVRLIYELIIVPFVALLWIVRFDVTKLWLNSFHFIVPVYLIVYWVSRKNIANHVFRLPSVRNDVDRFLIKNPPTSRFDLIVLDVFYVILCVVPFLFPGAIFFGRN